MDPQYNSPTSNFNGKRLANFLIVIGILGCLLLVITGLFGKSTVKFDVPNASYVEINGHPVDAKQPLRLKSGKYTVQVWSPQNQTLQSTLSVSPFRTIDYKPNLTPRDDIAIVSSAIGAYGNYGVPSVSNAKFFDNNTWFAGFVGPGSVTPIAERYANRQWQVEYFPAGSKYPNDITQLPADVLGYIKTTEVQYENR